MRVGRWLVGLGALLIAALAILRDLGVPVRLRAVGGFETPEYEALIQSVVHQHGVANLIEWVGFTRDVNAELNQMDLFVLPSIVAPDGQMEGIPVVLMEALAAGVPTISTRISGIPELVIDGKTGFLVEPAQPAALVTAVEHVLDDYAGAKRLAVFQHRPDQPADELYQVQAVLDARLPGSFVAFEGQVVRL